MRMNTERYPRLWEMLSCGCPFVQPGRDKVMREIFHGAVTELADRPEEACLNTQLLTAISAGMGAYLQSYRAQPVFKQKIREKFLEWLHAIGGKYHVELEDVQVDWVIPVQRDSGVELVRLLHDRKGLTKRELADRLGISTKTVQNDLRRLDPSLCEENLRKTPEPLRAAGHEMHVRIRCDEVPGSHGDRRYSTPDTLHPLVLQFNVTQVASMLMALQQSYDSGIYGTYCLESAMDIWCQLTPYCQSRIEKIFAGRNADFKAFLDTIRDEVKHGRFPKFRTERSMAEGATYREMLEYAYKAGAVCNITLRRNGVTEKYQKIRISENERGFEIVEEGQETRTGFTLDDVVSLEI